MLVTLELQTFYRLAREPWRLLKLRDQWCDNGLSLIVALVVLVVELVMPHDKSHRLFVLQIILSLNLFL